MADNFSVTKDSIQLPYRRFLADSAAGFVLILLGVAWYYAPMFSEASLRAAVLPSVLSSGSAPGQEAKVLVFLLLFLLATPIGFAVNAVSWLLIDQAISAVERICYRRADSGRVIFPIWDVTVARFGPRVATAFDLSSSNFNTAGWFFRDLLEAYMPDRFASQTHIKGLVVFLRNRVLYCLIGAFVCLHNAHRGHKWAFVAVCAAAVVATLVLRWNDPLRPNAARRRVFLVAAAAVFSLVGLLRNPAVEWLRDRAIVLMVVAAGTTIVIGFIEYYYHGAILIHAYFGATELGVDTNRREEKGLDRVFAIANEMIVCVAARAKPAPAAEGG